MSVRRLLVPLALIAATVGWAVQQPPHGTFPHSLHAKLFPSCTGCHAGILTGDTALMFPSPEVCARCHNGQIERRISWTEHVWTPNNLKFSHTLHATTSAQAGYPADCRNCHGLDAGRDTDWMHVAAPSPEACIACHQHRAPVHLAATAVCTTCHKPLVQATALSAATIASFPKPPSHDNPDWIATHAPTTDAQEAQCSICHARESCERCHANADRLPPIQKLGTDARVASLVRNVAPVYFVPAAHTGDNWTYVHGRQAAANPELCASCHTQNSCRTCHRGDLGRSTIEKLPVAKPGRAPGVVLVAPSGPGAAPPAPTLAAASRLLPPPEHFKAGDTVRTAVVSMHPPGFATNHKTVAASGLLDCQGCHKPQDCTSCHDGVSTSGGYHPADFMARHATQAFMAEQDCSTCHRVETFCRNCHQKSGIAANTGSVRGDAHNGQPMWLLQHGQAARQNLTSCTACHQQSDCLRCHSDLGLHVNPHGPNFPAQTMGSKDMQMCLVCHLTNPLTGGGG